MSWPPEILTALRRLEPTRAPSGGACVPLDAPLIERVSALMAAGIRLRGTLNGPPGVGVSTTLRRLAGALRHLAEPLLVRVSHSRRLAEHIPRWIAMARQVRGSRPPLLLVDGLDRVPVEGIEEVFGAGSRLCDEGLPSLIAAAPMAMAVLSPRRTRDPRLNLDWTLVPIPVQDASGLPDEAGLDVLAGALSRRLGGVGVLSDPDRLLRRTARSSGGIPGDAVRILREAVLVAGRAGRVDPVHIEAGERLLRARLIQSLPGRGSLACALDDGWFVGDPRLVEVGAVLPVAGGAPRWVRHPLLSPAR